MPRIAISSGHGKYIRGASGPQPIPPYCDEVDEVRKIVEAVAVELKRLKPPVDVVTFHDNTSRDQSTNLSTITSWHNKQTRDLDVSIHLNCYNQTAHGVEVLYVSQQALAAKVSAAIAAIGFTDRGAKKRTDLAFLNNTNKPAILIENHFCDNKQDCTTYRANFNQVCRAIAESLSGQQAQPGPTPPAKPEAPEPEPPAPEAAGNRTIGKGDTGHDVIELQKMIGVLVPDGDFGDITATWVRAFQSACGLTPDGVCGPKTWEQVFELDDRKLMGDEPLPEALAEKIYTAAQTSEIADYSWPDRGVAPPGYIAGVALSYAYCMLKGGDVVEVMQRAEGNADKDALALYKSEFNSLGMSNSIPGIDCMRHLFVLMVGLGPRESSGRYFEGRDLSADNVQAETAEAGLFQTSWNIKAADPTIAPLLPRFWDNPNGFQAEFREGLSPTANNLSCYGSGDGARYQWLARYCPLFTCLVTATGLRMLRAHWGPCGRMEIEIRKEADELLKEVQRLVGQG